MKITDEQIDTWLADAKKSSQGNWYQENVDFGFGSCVALNSETIVVCERNKHSGINNAAHIANLCPANAIQILEELKQLRRYASQMESAYVEEVMK